MVGEIRTSTPYLFIHIPKTGGTSLARKLGHFREIRPGVHDHRTIVEMQEITKWQVEPGARGPTLRERFDRRAQVVAPPTFAASFKFTIVRNSWSRVHSWYRNVARDPGHRAKLGAADDLPFSEFVEHHLGESGARTQLHWLRDRTGEIPLDFIGRFEHYDRDVAYILEQLGLDGGPVPHLMAGDTAPYTDAYDKRSRQLVADFYAEEIDHFGFNFGE